MAGLIYKLTYVFAAIVAAVHMVFAALATRNDNVWMDITISNLRTLHPEAHFDDPPRSIYAIGIFRAVWAAVSMVYYVSHLFVRRVFPNSWFVYSGVDLAIVLVLTAITIVAQVLSWGTADLSNMLDLIFFLIQMAATLFILVAELYAIIRGKQLASLRIVPALKTSVDHLLNPTHSQSDVEDGASTAAASLVSKDEH